jgi:hypothetical protein
MIGLRLILQFPEVASRSCEDCKTFVFEDKPGAMARKPAERLGEPVRRLPGPKFAPRCDICPKIPKGEQPKPENAVELSEKNWLAYRHFMECRSIGTFGEDGTDAIVRRNAFLIDKVRDDCKEVQGLRSSVIALRTVFKKNGV